MDYHIRFATAEDAGRITEYIDMYWKKGHILARDRELFKWQYGFMNKRFSIIIGEDEQGSMQGMLGYVPYDDTADKDIVLALWKTNEGTGFLGILLFQFLLENEAHRHILCVGINPDTTSKIYKSFGLKTGRMTHWYRLSLRQKYIIPIINNAFIPEVDVEGKAYRLSLVNSIAEMEDMFDFESLAYIRQIPYKSKQYIEHRYFSHPKYSYRVYVVCLDGCAAESALVFRIQDVAEAKVLRMIDCIGDVSVIYKISDAIDKLLMETEAEYADLYECGLNADGMTRGGWKEVEESGNIIPDWFSPFEQRNVSIFYASSSSAAVLFKGDGDQDRPS